MRGTALQGAVMIRLACFLDIPEIINLGNRYVEEEVKTVAHHSAVWDANMSACNLIEAYSRPDQFLHVATRDGEMVGFLWAASHALAPWNPTLVASDYLFYVVPEWRGSLVGLSLIKAYKSWAKDLGCAEVRLSLASGINEDRVSKMYERLGFSSFGTVFNHKLRSE